MENKQTIEITRKYFDIPDIGIVDKERRRLRRRARFKRITLRTASTLLVVAAVAVLVATLFLPILQVSGESMEPALYDKDVILLLKTKGFTTGDLIGFYHDGKILLKRVIAGPGDTVLIDEAGNVYVNQVLLDEPYVSEKTKGDCDIEFPYTVPGEVYFVMGDHRAVSVDSRNDEIGCISYDLIIGRIFWRIWPFSRFSGVA